MTSNDNQQYLTVDMFNSKMETFMTQIRLENEKLRGELKTEIQAVHTQVQVNTARIDMLQHTFYWGFAIMTVVIAVVAVFVPYFFREHKEKEQEQKQPGLTEERVQDMIAQALHSFKTAGKL